MFWIKEWPARRRRRTITVQKLDPAGLDVYKPAEVAIRIVEAGVGKAALPAVPLATLSVGGFFSNLIPVTIGNVIGGAGCVALTYRLACRPNGG